MAKVKGFPCMGTLSQCYLRYIINSFSMHGYEVCDDCGQLKGPDGTCSHPILNITLVIPLVNVQNEMSVLLNQPGTAHR